MTTETMKLALEALENTTPTGFNMERDKQFYAAITALRTAIAEAEKQEPVAKQKLVGWRTADFLRETTDIKLAQNWEVHYEILPIFEGDLNTKLVAPPAQEFVCSTGLCHYKATSDERLMEMPKQEPVRLQCVHCGTVYADGVPPAVPAPVQEPVGEVVVESMGVPGSDAMQVRIHFYKEIPPVGSKVYTTPLAAQRQWVRLTESDRRLICFQWQDGNQTATEIIDLVEVKLKERNHG